MVPESQDPEATFSRTLAQPWVWTIFEVTYDDSSTNVFLVAKFTPNISWPIFTPLFPFNFNSQLLRSGSEFLTVF